MQISTRGFDSLSLLKRETSEKGRKPDSQQAGNTVTKTMDRFVDVSTEEMGMFPLLRRGRAVVARKAHILEVDGANPSPASKKELAF